MLEFKKGQHIKICENPHHNAQYAGREYVVKSPNEGTNGEHGRYLKTANNEYFYNKDCQLL